jgi:molybdenum cofactor cytidylyltransferase
MKVGVLVLAAGRAVRFGADKRLARLPDGRQVIDALLDNLADSGLPVLVCIGSDDRELAAHLAARQVPSVPCRRSAEGMGGTLAEGVGHVRDWDGLLVALADMPWIEADTYRALAAALSSADLCVPVFGGRRGHPVGFGARHYDELGRLGGDTGARALLDQHATSVRELQVQDPAIHRDIDHPDDLSAAD